MRIRIRILHKLHIRHRLVPTSYACQQLVSLVTVIGDVASILRRVHPLFLLVGHLAVLWNSIAINYCPLNKRTFLGATNNCSTYSVIESHYLHHLVVKVTDTLLYIIAIISHLFSQTKIGCRSYRCYNYTLPPPVTLIAQPGSQTTITYAVLQLSRFCLHSSA